MTVLTRYFNTVCLIDSDIILLDVTGKLIRTGPIHYSYFKQNELFDFVRMLGKPWNSWVGGRAGLQGEFGHNQ